MILKNALVYMPDFKFHKADVRVADGKITEAAHSIDEVGEDCTGKMLLPGFIDIHSHGCMGCDWSRADRASYEKMTAYYAKNGVTSLCATTMSLPGERLGDAMSEIKSFMESDESGGAYVHGINMEGPFFSKKKKGAQAEENLFDPNLELFNRLWKISGENIKLCDIAPELPGAMEFIEKVKGRCVISIAHTAADYAVAKSAIAAGASHVTHLYNAMTPFTHRAPGVVGAVYDSNVTAEMICDGIHLDPAVVRITFQILGDERVTLISDSMEACGMPNGEYELGGQRVQVNDGSATLADGTLAGSATNLFQCTRRAIDFGVPAEIAIKAATYNPARTIGVLESAGTIERGKSADLVLTNERYEIERVWVRGKEIL